MAIDTLADYVPGIIVVTFKDQVEPEKIEDILSGFEYGRAFPTANPDALDANERSLGRTYRVSVTRGEEDQSMGDLQKDYAAYIERTEPWRYPLACRGCPAVCDLGELVKS